MNRFPSLFISLFFLTHHFHHMVSTPLCIFTHKYLAYLLIRGVLALSKGPAKRYRAQFIALSSIRVLINRFLIKIFYIVVKFLLAKRGHFEGNLKGLPGIFPVSPSHHAYDGPVRPASHYFFSQSANEPSCHFFSHSGVSKEGFRGSWPPLC